MQANAALNAAVAARRSITVISAPDAGISAGPGWFKAVIDAARNAVPQARAEFILDCGDNAGATQGAIRAGIAGIIFTGRSDVAARLAAIAAASGARLLTTRPHEALDLGRWFFADVETLSQRCAEYLASPETIC